MNGLESVPVSMPNLEILRRVVRKLGLSPGEYAQDPTSTGFVHIPGAYAVQATRLARNMVVEDAENFLTFSIPDERLYKDIIKDLQERQIGFVRQKDPKTGGLEIRYLESDAAILLDVVGKHAGEDFALREFYAGIDFNHPSAQITEENDGIDVAGGLAGYVMAERIQEMPALTLGQAYRLARKAQRVAERKAKLTN